MNPNSANKQEQNYNLSVGAFANLCNTTRDTLRHYYEIGLLVPKTDKSNGYHYYDSSQITAFYFLLNFLSFLMYSLPNRQINSYIVCLEFLFFHFAFSLKNLIE